MHYKYAWGNNPKRAKMKGRTCRILATGKMGSALVEFQNGQREITSRRALRKWPSGKEIKSRLSTPECQEAIKKAGERSAEAIRKLRKLRQINEDDLIKPMTI